MQTWNSGTFQALSTHVLRTWRRKCHERPSAFDNFIFTFYLSVHLFQISWMTCYTRFNKLVNYAKLTFFSSHVKGSLKNPSSEMTRRTCSLNWNLSLFIINMENRILTEIFYGHFSHPSWIIRGKVHRPESSRTNLVPHVSIGRSYRIKHPN